MAEKTMERPVLPPVVNVTGKTTVIVSGKLDIRSSNPNVKIERSD